VEIIVKTNGYFTETKPWELKKKDVQRFEAVVCDT
jgi:methionyl-tRNA synthetase